MLPIVSASYGKKDPSLISDKFNYMLCSTMNKYPTTLFYLETGAYVSMHSWILFLWICFFAKNLIFL